MESNKFTFKPVPSHPELVSPSIFSLTQKMNNPDVMVAEIDPAYMGGKELCEHYGVDPNEGANCVIVEATYADHTSKVAIIVPVGYRADLNGLVRKHLGAKKISLANLDAVLAETGMEYGSITPFGLPEDYKILVDSRLMEKEKIIVGGGRQVSKLLLPTSIFREIGAEIIENLSNPAY